MNNLKSGSPSGKFGSYELQKIVSVATFLASSGLLTQITTYLSGIDMGKWGTIIMAAWNLLLAVIYYLAKDNSIAVPPSPTEDLKNAP